MLLFGLDHIADLYIHLRPPPFPAVKRHKAIIYHLAVSRNSGAEICPKFRPPRLQIFFAAGAYRILSHTKDGAGTACPINFIEEKRKCEMLEYRAEGLCRNANHLRRDELERCIATGEVLQSTALAFDNNRRLRFELCGCRAYMPFEECLEVSRGETIKDIAVLTRVGRPTCFVVTGAAQEEGETVYLLSRAAAQRACRTQYLDTLEAGSVIPCTVTHIENFGAFCDIGCGISALLPIDCLSVSRISSPADRVSVGQQLLCAIKTRDAQGRIVLTLRELLGTWSENAACFAAGETVVGIVRSVEDYGVFIEIAPNLAGLAEPDGSLRAGQSVSVYIKSILPDKMKIKLVVVNKNLGQSLRFEPHYFVTKGRLKHWTYSTPQSRKQIETVF